MSATLITLTYGDPDATKRDVIGTQLVNAVRFLYPSAVFYCDRFTGSGIWTGDDGATYSEHSGNIVVAVPGISNLPYLRSLVATTAFLNGQDAIGFIVSHSANTLVTPNERVI